MEYPFVVNSTNSMSILWNKKPYLAVPYVLTLGIAALIGTLGNLLIIATIALMIKRRRRNVGNVFVLNLALSDLIVTSIINPFSIVGVIRGVDFYHAYFGLCRGLASICVISCVGSLLTIGNIAINRYIYICHHSSYSKSYSTIRCILACIMCWMLGVLMDLPSHIGWSRHTFDKKSHKCIWDRRHRYHYTVLLMVVGVMLPLFVIVVFYALIYRHVRKIKLRLSRHSKNGGSGDHQVMRVAKQTKMMFFIFLGFSVCWLPYILVLLLDKNDEYPIEVHLLASMCAHLHASINFIIYGLGNSSFRQSYQEIIMRCVSYCCKQKEYPMARYSDEPQDDVAVPELNIPERSGCGTFLGCCNLNNLNLTASMSEIINLATPLPQQPACVISPSENKKQCCSEALLKVKSEPHHSPSCHNYCVDSQISGTNNITI